jgi:serine protease
MSSTRRSFRPTSSVFRGVVALAAGLCLAGTAWAVPNNAPVDPPAVNGQELVPRKPAGPPALYELPPETAISHVVIKFHEGTRVRLRNDELAAAARSKRDLADLAARGLGAAQVSADLHAVQALVGSHNKARGLERRFRLAEPALERMRAEGEAASGEQLADLDLYYQVPVPAGTLYLEVEGLLQALNAVPSVEIAYAPSIPEPASIDLGPRLLTAAAVTPSFQGQQGYLNAAPAGVDAYYAWTKAGGSGFGVKVVDIEYSWQTTHEDLPTFFRVGGGTTSLFRDHGTAVVGEIVGEDNGLGIKGVAYRAKIGGESVSAQSTASAIANASASVINGDILLIELHAPGPFQAGCGCSGSQCHYVPMEYWQDNFDAIKTATTNGRSVVEAAGNGSANLNDRTAYGPLFYRTYRDSGAVLVGARNSANGFASCFSNYGYRVDVNAWGQNVVTTGYGDLYNGGTEDSWYTSGFGGTSSASPIVVGAAADLQGASFSNPPYNTRTPSEIRLRLMSNATWEWGNLNFIGPQPNLRGALDQLINGNRLPTAGTDFLSTPRNTLLSIGYGTLLANDSDPDGDALSVFWYDFETLNGGTTDCCHAGGFNYTPPLNFTGTDYLNYRIQDARGLVTFGTVAITVN